jgi:hypothetical protein
VTPEEKLIEYLTQRPDWKDPVREHSLAENLMLECLPPTLRSLWEEASCDWWYS